MVARNFGNLLCVFWLIQCCVVILNFIPYLAHELRL